jgi:hypothetical protein
MSKIEQFKNFKTKTINSHLSGLTSSTLNGVFWLGLILVIAAFFLPDQRKILLIIGIGLIVFVLVFQVILIIGCFLLKFRSRSSGSGGFGGGSSGGGGASGGW